MQSSAARPAPTPAVGPYRLTCWAGRSVTLGEFASFTEALRAFAYITETDKAIVNDDRAELGRSGLTDTESDAVYSLPVTRAATEAELAAALQVLS